MQQATPPPLILWKGLIKVKKSITTGEVLEQELTFESLRSSGFYRLAYVRSGKNRIRKGRTLRFKAISLMLVLFVLAGGMQALAAPAFSDNVAPLLAELKIMQGDPDGNLRLDAFVSRAECTKIAVAASSYRDTVATGSKTSPFKDVSADHWAAPYITVAVKNGLCKGYLDATFKPSNTVTYEEALTMFLRVLGYSEEDFGTSWPDGQIGIAQNIGLCDGLVKSAGQELTRRDVMNIVYNLLNTPAKGSATDYISTFDRSITDDVVLIASNNEDSSVSAGKVLTSAGTYKITDDFDFSNIGKRGSITLRNGDTIVSFIPNEQTVEEYTVSGTMGSDILFGDNILDVDEGTPVYYKSQTYTYETVAPEIDSGDVCKIFRDKNNEIDYILFTTTPKSSSLAPLNTKTCVVSSVMGDKVLGYVGDELLEITLNQTVAYYDGNDVSSYAQVSSKIKSGDSLTLRYDDDNQLQYIIYNRVDENSDVDSPAIRRHIVYSILGDSIITYESGAFDKLDFTAGTVFYEDDTQTSYSAISQKLAMGDVLNVKYKQNGSIDYVIYEEGNTIGPVTVTGSTWYSSFGVDPDSTTIMRDGVKTTLDDIQVNDIAYYSTDLNMILTYSKKVTGVYESASPNKDTPSSVTVSGVTYTLEGVEAFTKLSSSGSFNFGDTVTLLLGRSGEVADVLSQSQLSDEVYGYLIETGTKETTVNGSSVTKPYVRVILSSGESSEYITTKDYASLLNRAVKVSFQDGSAIVTVASQQSDVSGLFTWSSTTRTLGSSKLDSGLTILEVSTTNASESGKAATVFPQRLSGLTLYASNILYAGKNAEGKITELIINDTTGDMHDYGIVTSAKNNANGMSISGTYTYLVDGNERTLATNGSAYTVSSGQPVKIETSENGTVIGMTSLSKVSGGKVTDITGSKITFGGKVYEMSDDVSIYYKDASYNYSMMTLDELKSSYSDYNISLYSDKSESLGGRIRIILVTP